MVPSGAKNTTTHTQMRTQFRGVLIRIVVIVLAIGESRGRLALAQHEGAHVLLRRIVHVNGAPMQHHVAGGLVIRPRLRPHDQDSHGPTHVATAPI
eukprot:740475-Prorocentrum_minimum.AAC.3